MKLTPPPVQNKPATEPKEATDEVESSSVDSRASAGDIFVSRDAIEAERDSQETAENSEETEEATVKQESVQDKADRIFEFMAFVANQSADKPGNVPDPVDSDYDYGVSDADLYGETEEY